MALFTPPAIPHDAYPVLKPVKKPRAITSGIGGSLGFFKLNPYHKPTVAPVVNTPGAPPAGDPNGGFYPFNDYYGNLLTQLASMRDLAMSGLSSDAATRIKNSQAAIDASRGPLNQNYSRAEQEAAAVNDAVANRLHDQGTNATTDLRSQLAALGQDPTAATAALGNTYSGTVGANYALDSGDVQRLIGRQAEENTLLNKQGPLQAAQINSDLAQSQGGIISDYLDKAFQLKGQSADAHTAYDQAKQQFDTTQSGIAADRADKAEQLYWDNYWQKQSILFKKWQTQIASQDKKGAQQTQKEIANLKASSAADVANIRANASAYTADTSANAKVTAAGISAEARKAAATTAANKKKAASSNVSKQRAYQAALKAIIDPKTNTLVSAVNPTGYNSDWTITRIVNNTLKSFGISPQSPQGRSVVASILAQASGHKFSPGAVAAWNAAHPDQPIDANGRYKYDPNWVKKAKNAAKKKKKK